MKAKQALFSYGYVVATLSTIWGCGGPQPRESRKSVPAHPQAWQEETPSSHGVVLVDDVHWDQLNPARGDKSPMAANVWGDRNRPGPAGFLFRPVDGFRSPPHIHNVSYRGVVIRGEVHNDHPDAKDMWMSAGAFWTQPRGGLHVTASRGDNILAYIEVEDGPYLVRSPEEAFSVDEKPVNLTKPSLPWETSKDESESQSFREAKLWEEPKDGALPGFQWVRAASTELCQSQYLLIELCILHPP